MKKLSNLKGAKALNKQEQQNITGGHKPFLSSGCRTQCPPTCQALHGKCYPCTYLGNSGFECRISG